MFFSTSLNIFKAIESGKIEEIIVEMNAFSTYDELPKLSSHLIRFNNKLKSCNLLEACCLVNNAEAMRLLSKKTTWSLFQIKEAARLAASMSQSIFMDELISLGYDPNDALIEASEAGNTALMQHLLKNNNDKVDITNSKPIYRAAHLGHLDILKTLHEYGFNLHAEEDQALIIAVRGKYIDIIRHLISIGANVNTKKELALKTAIMNDDVEIIKELLNTGANLRLVAREEFVSLADHYGKLKAVKFLREKLAEINASPLINTHQSTHISSVDSSVAKSVLRLEERYKDLIETNADKINQSILDWKKSFTTSGLDTAANRALTNMLESKNVSCQIKYPLKDIFYLCWAAIHDDTLRKGDLSESLMILKEGLYEIQRGYNLSTTDVDEGGEDQPICMDGQINKLIEKLIGIHPDASIDILTKEIASLKLRAITKEKAMKYIASLSPLIKASIFKTTPDLETIWPTIREQVKEQLFKEFFALFKSYDDPEFDEFVDMGIYTRIDDESKKPPYTIPPANA